MAKGKRIGTRRAARKRTLPSRSSLLHSLCITLCVVAWGFLVKAAIDFGTAARDGEHAAWAFLGLACVGAAACLFTGLIIGVRLLRSLGILTESAAVGAPDVDTAVAEQTRPSPAGEDSPTYAPPPAPYRGKRMAR